MMGIDIQLPPTRQELMHLLQTQLEDHAHLSPQRLRKLTIRLRTARLKWCKENLLKDYIESWAKEQGLSVSWRVTDRHEHALDVLNIEFKS